ncbi:hypothetical protein [Methylobacterium sp. SD21]|uniref:hypothetical protein n=1 Tax=Methylobacterium litchii TaxID=3138810 RepID=UPI00313AB17F
MCDLIEFPAQQPQQPATRTRGMPTARIIFSERVTKPSTYGKDVEYARLSDEDHDYLRGLALGLWDVRASLRSVLSAPSTMYGRRGAGRKQTLEDILEGIVEKMQGNHPVVRARVGKDLSIKQLTAFNRIVRDVNALLGSTFAETSVP